MAALDDYGPFDGGVGANRTEDFWRDFFRHLTGSGVIDGVGSEFAVVERGAGANLSVDVGSGECFIRGHWGESTATKNVAISTGHATNPRIDRVVLRADFTANTISIEVLEGTPAGSPSAPALTQSSSRWELSLAQISVPALDTSIGTAQITDERNVYSYGPSRTVPSARSSRTAGSLTLNSTTWADVNIPDLTLTSVRVGDVIEVGVSGAMSSEAVDGYLDVASIVSAAPVNYWSGNNGGAASTGVGSWYGPSGEPQPIGGSIQRAVVSGDLSGGSLTLRLRYRTSTATNKTLGASANQPLHFHAKNLGQ